MNRAVIGPAEDGGYWALGLDQPADYLFENMPWSTDRVCAITLARHGEPALSRKCMITSDQYRDWWGRYEIGGLRAGQTPPQALLSTAEAVGASPLPLPPP